MTETREDARRPEDFPRNRPGTAAALIMISAGEASGDHHAAAVVRALRERRPEVRLIGLAGREMRAAGVASLYEAEKLAVVGLTEVVARLPVILSAMTAARRAIRQRRPDLLILVDYQDFNLRLARYARRFGVKTLFYIGPTVWAWRRGRVYALRDCVDHMAVILPFEENFYRRYRLPATFVGHPLLEPHGSAVDFSAGPPPPERFAAPVTVGLLPGSRNSELRRLLPPLLETACRMAEEAPDLRFLLSRADSVDRGLFAEILERHPAPANTEIVDGVAPAAARCGFAIVASGTASLEIALAGVPFMVVYKVSRLSYTIGRAMIRAPFICMANLIAGKELAPEFIQGDIRPEILAAEALGRIRRPDFLLSVSRELAALSRRLGSSGAAERVAAAACSLLAGGSARDEAPADKGRSA